MLFVHFASELGDAVSRDFPLFRRSLQSQAISPDDSGKNVATFGTKPKSAAPSCYVPHFLTWSFFYREESPSAKIQLLAKMDNTNHRNVPQDAHRHLLALRRVVPLEVQPLVARAGE